MRADAPSCLLFSVFLALILPRRRYDRYLPDLEHRDSFTIGGLSFGLFLNGVLIDMAFTSPREAYSDLRKTTRKRKKLMGVAKVGAVKKPPKYNRVKP